MVEEEILGSAVMTDVSKIVVVITTEGEGAIIGSTVFTGVSVGKIKPTVVSK